MEIIIRPSLPADSADYEVLVEAVRKVVSVAGMTCEIGLRRGGGSRYILDTLLETQQKKLHIAIDPYGNIPYAPNDKELVLFDYTNKMRNECLLNIYLYCVQKNASFLFFNMEDSEFFARFSDGVPVYEGQKRIETHYSLVHFDGPHSVAALKAEVDFFHPRAYRGAVFVFDDVELYEHSEVDAYLTTLGWSAYRKAARKWAYSKG
jgi:hypothetical protein